MFFNTHKNGELVSHLGSDTTLLNQASSLTVSKIVMSSNKLATCLGIYFWLLLQLASVTVGLVTDMFLMCVLFGQKIATLLKRYHDACSKAQTQITEAPGGI